MLHESIERIHRLRGRAPVNINDSRVLSVALHIVRHIEPRRDRPFTVAAGIVHQLRLDHVIGGNARQQRVCDLVRTAVAQVIDPGVVGCVRAVVVIQQARTILSECRLRAAQRVHAFRQRQGSGFSGRETVDVNIRAAVHIRGPGYGLPIRRKIAGRNLPFVFGKPIDFL